MALKDGDLYVDGTLLPFEQTNRIMTHFRGTTIPSNLQPGAFFSKSTDDKLQHEGAAAPEEILQETRSWDVSPEFSGLPIICNEGEVVTNEGEVVFNPTSP